MGNIIEIHNRLSSLNLIQLLDECIWETREVLLSLNKKQLSVGDKSTGIPLQDYASETYADFKKNIVGSLAPLLTPDLKLEGHFYEGFGIEIGALDVIIMSSDSKAGQLEQKYGSDIYGLTPDNLTFYSIEIILPLLQRKVRAHVGI